MLDLWVPGGQPSKPRGWGTTLGAIEGGQDACRERSWPPPMALGVATPPPKSIVGGRPPQFGYP
jgi:hypothetical protein